MQRKNHNIEISREKEKKNRIEQVKRDFRPSFYFYDKNSHFSNFDKAIFIFLKTKYTTEI